VDSVICERCGQDIPEEQRAFVVADKKGFCLRCYQVAIWIKKNCEMYETSTRSYKPYVSDWHDYIDISLGQEIDWHGSDELWLRCDQCSKGDDYDHERFSEDEIIEHAFKKHSEEVNSIIVHLEKKEKRNKYSYAGNKIQSFCGESFVNDGGFKEANSKRWICNCAKCLKELEDHDQNM